MATPSEIRARLIARNKALLAKKADLSFGTKKPTGEVYDEYSFKLPWKGMHYWVLTPSNFEWTDLIHNFYLGERPRFMTSPLMTCLVHGHTREERCFARYQCHVLGYKPTGDEPKLFLERWKRFGYSS